MGLSSGERVGTVPRECAALPEENRGKLAWLGRESSVRLALESPDEVRQSRTDPEVLLFYKVEEARRWVCAVAKQALIRHSW